LYRDRFSRPVPPAGTLTDAPHEARLVHVLISEPFFWDKVKGTLLALGREPRQPDWERPVLEQLLAEPGAGLVVDLECERIAALTLLQRLRRDPASRGLPILAYCSHLRRDLIHGARRMGLEVVPRSTFAANLVRLLQDLGPSDGPGT